MCIGNCGGHETGLVELAAGSYQQRLILGCARVPLTSEILGLAGDLGIDELDTAYNYNSFRSLEQLRGVAAFETFRITSKVGFFQREGGGTRHSLDPVELGAAVEDTVRRLDSQLDTILIHNPEASLVASIPCDPLTLDRACEAMARCVERGLSKRWGLSLWRTRGLPPNLRLIQRPEVIMTRCGLTVGIDEIKSIMRLQSLPEGAHAEHRGMAPFGGSRSRRLLSNGNLESLCPGASSTAAAALRLAFELPKVDRVCFSTSSCQHLREASEAIWLDLDDQRG